MKEKKRKRIFFLFLALHFGRIKESHTKPDFVDGSCLLFNALTLYIACVHVTMFTSHFLPCDEETFHQDEMQGARGGMRYT